MRHEWDLNDVTIERVMILRFATDFDGMIEFLSHGTCVDDTPVRLLKKLTSCRPLNVFISFFVFASKI
jgi:hypothetical protein